MVRCPDGAKQHEKCHCHTPFSAPHMLVKARTKKAVSLDASRQSTEKWQIDPILPIYTSPPVPLPFVVASSVPFPSMKVHHRSRSQIASDQRSQPMTDTSIARIPAESPKYPLSQATCRTTPVTLCFLCGIADYRCYTPTSFSKNGLLSQSKDKPWRGVGHRKQNLPLKPIAP